MWSRAQEMAKAGKFKRTKKQLKKDRVPETPLE
jgi:hypothetical protein